MNPAAFSFPGGCVPSSGLVSILTVLLLLVSPISSLLSCTASKHPLSSAPPHSPDLLLSQPDSSCTLSSKPEPRASLFCKETPQCKSPPEFPHSQGLPYPPLYVQHLELRAHPYIQKFLPITSHTHSTARFLCPTRDMFIYNSLNFMGQFINKTRSGFQQRFDLNPTCLLYSF